MTFDKQLRFDSQAPLHPLDSEKQTYGCRANEPNACANVCLEGICAFTSSDAVCKRPTIRWKRQYQMLLAMQDEPKA